MMAPVVQRLEAEGYPVREVDVDRDAALAGRYGVTNIPCFVLVVDGQERGRIIGATSYERLAGLLAKGGVGRAGEGIVSSRGQSPDRPRKLLSLPASFLRNRSPAPAAPEKPSSRQPFDTPLPSPKALALAEQRPLSQLDQIALDLPPKRAAASEKGSDSLSARLLRSSVRLKIYDPHGYSFGSGTIIEYSPRAGGLGGQALILTCGHIFRDSRGQGRIEVDLFDQGKVQTVVARMVRHDLQRDIGLVSIETDRAVPVAPLASKKSQQSPGSQVLSIGCDHGNDPTVQKSTIKAVNSFVGPANLQVVGQPAVGRSGGGLFNHKGELIGVCNFADPTDRAGLYAAVELAHAVLQKSAPWISTAGVVQPESSDPVGTDLMALADEQLLNGNASELICIVRSGSGPESQHRVIVIDKASRELLEQLDSERAKNRRTFPTSMALETDRSNRQADIPSNRDSGNGPHPAWQ
jgi:S1-C subfamily serine protease